MKLSHSGRMNTHTHTMLEIMTVVSFQSSNIKSLPVMWRVRALVISESGFNQEVKKLALVCNVSGLMAS